VRAARASALEHQRLHALTGRLQQILATGGELDGVMRELGELPEAHIRLEERRLFPLIERRLEDVSELQRPWRDEIEAAAPAESRGAADGLTSDELNATPLSWKAGTGPPEHVNEERDVLVVVLLPPGSARAPSPTLRVGRVGRRSR
jgi:Hemerythrin HHE cation binding domain